MLDGITAGTVAASKAVVADGSKDVSGFNDVSATTFTGDLVGDVQTTTLTVIGGVTADTTYQCEIHGTKYDASINVYSKLIQTMH